MWISYKSSKCPEGNEPALWKSLGLSVVAMRRVQNRISADSRVVDPGASPVLFKNHVAPHKTTFFPQITTQSSVCASVLSSFFFCSFSKLPSIRFSIWFSNSKMSFRQAGQKRRGDLSDAFPKVGRCLKCFKHLLIDPEAKCISIPGRKNCERCSKGGETCGLVSSFKIPAWISHFSLNFPEFSKIDTEILDSLYPFGNLPGLERYNRDLEDIS